jgi:cytoskeleton protein RodZ
MSPDPGGGIGTEIGATLHDARKRLGLDIREVEDRTKIRTRYLRALENEDWEALPAPAYVRGFLRAYGQVLGLDGEMLADEYRRRHEQTEASTPSGATEPVLRESRRPAGERPPSRGLLIAGLVVGLVAILLVLGLLGGNGDDDAEQSRGQDRRESRQEKRARERRRERRQESKPAPLERTAISVEALSTVTLCLIGGSDDTLIDSQVLPPDTVETHGGSKRYRLDVVGGSVRIEIADERQKVEAGEEGVSVEADSRGIRSIDYQGPDCP